MRKSRLTSYLSILTVGLVAVTGESLSQDERQAIEAVRERIESLESRIADQHVARDARARELRDAELAISAATESLAKLRDDLAEQRRELSELAAASAASRSRLASESNVLHQQMRLSYKLGQAEFLKLLLNQENPAELGRMLGYYDYLNRARSERIEVVRVEVANLAALAESTRAGERELARLEAAQQGEVDELKRVRAARGELLAELDASIEQSGEQIESLRLEEQRLAELLVEIGDILAAFPTGAEAPFETLKGRLAWPVKGETLGDYGRPRDGGPLRWNGVVIGADAGTSVRAIYHGRVAFSDWLPGLGLLLIVDHGGGYLSLYGYNEVLTKESGDWVEPGEVIAQVGDTGGQAVPALYFELRRDGRPINPHDWFADSP